MTLTLFSARGTPRVSSRCQTAPLANAAGWRIPDFRMSLDRSVRAPVVSMVAAFIARAGDQPMRKADVLKLPSMPMAGPSYPAGPYRFINREFLVITYETDPALIRAGLPEPLEPIDQPIVKYEWIKMPDSSGFGSYTESGLVIPARF